MEGKCAITLLSSPHIIRLTGKNSYIKPSLKLGKHSFSLRSAFTVCASFYTQNKQGLLRLDTLNCSSLSQGHVVFSCR